MGVLSVPRKLATAQGPAFSFSARGFCSLNIGSGTPVFTRSENTGGVVDNGVGDYTIQLYQGVPSANMVVVATCGSFNNTMTNRCVSHYQTTPTSGNPFKATNSVRLLVGMAGLEDNGELHVVFFG